VELYLHSQYGFMALCSVEGHGQLYLHLTFNMGGEMKDDAIAGACTVHGGNEKFIRSFSRQTST
jgi:hypothetical protein